MFNVYCNRSVCYCIFKFWCEIVRELFIESKIVGIKCCCVICN